MVLPSTCPTDDGSAVDRATASAFDDGSFDGDQVICPSISETADPFSRLFGLGSPIRWAAGFPMEATFNQLAPSFAVAFQR